MMTTMIWARSFVLLVILAALSLAASGSMIWFRRIRSMQARLAVISFVAILAALGCGMAYLGHPERIFGAFQNPHSVLSRELIVLVAFVATSAYCSFRSASAKGDRKLMSGLAMAVAVTLLVATIQLCLFWSSRRIHVGMALPSGPPLCSLQARPIA